jgi:RNA polymerase sigma-70 factor (ECF subfamily)
VLRRRAEKPELSSADIAEQLGGQLGRTLTADTVRQTLHRAREKFAALLLEEVGRSLQSTSTPEIEQELMDLGLHSYCQPALSARRQ